MADHIYKYPFTGQVRPGVRVPRGAALIPFGLDPSGEPHVWALVPDSGVSGYDIYGVFMTGEEAPANEVHVGTCRYGDLMLHLFGEALDG